MGMRGMGSFFDFSSYEDYKGWRIFVGLFPVLTILGSLTLFGLFVAGLVLNDIEYGREYAVKIDSMNIKVGGSTSLPVLYFVPIRTYPLQTFPAIIYYSTARFNDFDYFDIYDLGNSFARNGVAFFVVDAPFYYEDKAIDNMIANINATIKDVYNIDGVYKGGVSLMSNEMIAYLMLSMPTHLIKDIKAYVLIDPPATFHLFDHPHDYFSPNEALLSNYHTLLSPRYPTYDFDATRTQTLSDQFKKNVIKDVFNQNPWNGFKIRGSVTVPVYVLFSSRCPFYYSIETLYAFLQPTCKKVKILAGPWEHDTWPELSNEPWSVNSRGDISQFVKQFVRGMELGFLIEPDWLVYHNTVDGHRYSYSTSDFRSRSSKTFYFNGNNLDTHFVPTNDVIKITVTPNLPFSHIEIFEKLDVKVDPLYIWSTSPFTERLVMLGESSLSLKKFTHVGDKNVPSYFMIVLMYRAAGSTDSYVLNKRVFSSKTIETTISLGTSSWVFNPGDVLQLAIFPASPPEVWFSFLSVNSYIQFKEQDINLLVSIPQKDIDIGQIPLKHPLGEKYHTKPRISPDYKLYNRHLSGSLENNKQLSDVSGTYFQISKNIFGKINSELWQITPSKTDKSETLVGQGDIYELVVTDYVVSDTVPSESFSLEEVANCIESKYTTDYKATVGPYSEDEQALTDFPKNVIIKKGFIFHTFYTITNGKNNIPSFDCNFKYFSLAKKDLDYCNSIKNSQ